MRSREILPQVKRNTSTSPSTRSITTRHVVGRRPRRYVEQKNLLPQKHTTKHLYQYLHPHQRAHDATPQSISKSAASTSDRIRERVCLCICVSDNEEIAGQAASSPNVRTAYTKKGTRRNETIHTEEVENERKRETTKRRRTSFLRNK